MSFPAPLLLAMSLVSSSTAAFAQGSVNDGYWQALAWEQRPLLMVVGSSNRAERQARGWEERLLADRCALAERRIHWLEVRDDGVWRRFAGEEGAQFERTPLPQDAAERVRDRVQRRPDGSARLLLFGLDGQRKYVGHPRSLETIWSLIDRMPMRRAELERDPDDCSPS